MKAFTLQEKEYYLNQLTQKGRDIFARYGIKKTTVEDLTKAVGIAKGSFYMFFPSKEELYFHILEQEVGTLRQQAARKLFETDAEPYILLKGFLGGILKSIQNNPILAMAFTGEGRELLERDAIKNRLRENGDIRTGLKELFELLIQRGIVIQADPDFLVNLVRTMFIINTNKDMLDAQFFDQTMEFMADSIAKAIAVK